MDIRSLNGFSTGQYSLKLTLYRQGRFVEEYNFAFDLVKGDSIVCKWFLYGKVFYGRKPYYRPWLEVAYKESCLNEIPQSILKEFLGRMMDMIPSGSHMMVEYDFDTYRELMRKPVEEVWLGKLFLERGFRNLRNWYIPEGWKEGGMKIQGWKI